MGAPRKIDLDLAREMLAQVNPATSRFHTMGEVADRFGVTRQAVSKALRDSDEGRRSERKLPPWPWRMAREHVDKPSTTYRLMQAYRKHANGLAVTPKELSDAKALRKFAEKLDMAVTYDRETGFYWTSRRVDDGEEMFVVRD